MKFGDWLCAVSLVCNVGFALYGRNWTAAVAWFVAGMFFTALMLTRLVDRLKDEDRRLSGEL